MGTDAIYFLQNGHQVILIDISDYALMKAEEKTLNMGLNIKTYRATLGEEQIPLKSKTVDVVYSRLAIHYFDRQTTIEIIQDIYRIMKDGGKAFITVKSPGDQNEMDFLKSTATEKESGVFEDNGTTKSRFTKQQLEDILKQAGILSFTVRPYVEDLSDKIDKTKSGNKQLLLNEIQIIK